MKPLYKCTLGILLTLRSTKIPAIRSCVVAIAVAVVVGVFAFFSHSCGKFSFFHVDFTMPTNKVSLKTTIFFPLAADIQEFLAADILFLLLRFATFVGFACLCYEKRIRAHNFDPGRICVSVLVLLMYFFPFCSALGLLITGFFSHF